MSLLQRELRFCCRASALQSQHVSRLSLAIVEAVEGSASAMPTSEQAGGLAASSPSQLLLPEAARALRGVLAAHDRLVRQPSEGALHDVVSELAAARNALDSAPDAMETASLAAGNLQVCVCREGGGGAQVGLAQTCREGAWDTGMGCWNVQE